MENLKFISNIQWQLNSTCNLKCKHCFLSEPNVNKESTDYKTALKIINIMKNNGIEKIDFTLKEPLAYKNIYELLKYCYNANIGTDVLTNGTLLANEENVKKLFEANLLFLSTSLEGISIETNDFIRGNGTFNKVIDGINVINKYRKEYNLYFPIIIHMTLNSVNVNECSKFPEFFNKLGIDALSISEIDLAGEAKKNKDLKIDTNKLNESFQKIIYSYSKLDKKNFTILTESMSPLADLYFNLEYNLNIPVNRPRCSVLSDNYIINSDGELCACPRMLYGDFNNENYPGLVKCDVMNPQEYNKFYDSISRFKKYIFDIKNTYQYKCCSECIFYEECTLCPFVSKDLKSLNGVRDICYYYKNKIDQFIEDVINNLYEYKFQLKNTAIITKDNDQYIFENNYKFGAPYKKKMAFDLEQQIIIEDILKKSDSNINYQIQKLNEPQIFLNKIISTDCIEFLKRRK